MDVFLKTYLLTMRKFIINKRGFMFNVISNFGDLVKDCPSGPQVLLFIIYLNQNGMPCRFSDLSRVIKPALVTESINYLEKNNIINSILIDEEVYYIASVFIDILSMNLTAADKYDILAALRKVFPDAARFNSEVSCLEHIIRKFKLYSKEDIIKVLNGLEFLNIKTLAYVSQNDVDLFLSTGISEKSEKEHTATEFHLAKLAYRKLTISTGTKERCQRMGVKKSDLNKFLAETQESYELENVIDIMNKMPVKFKFLEN